MNKPIQAEKGEFILLDNGQIVPVAAKKLHKNMDEEQISDMMPSEDFYVFSNTPSMKLSKEHFGNTNIPEHIPEYKEGQKKPREYSEKSFIDSYFTKKEHTPAEIANNISKKHRVITDEETKNNIYIQRANKMNIENRSQLVNKLVSVSDQIKPFAQEIDNIEGNNYSGDPGEMSSPEYVIEQFRYGGGSGKKARLRNLNITNYNSSNMTPDYQWGGWGDVFQGAISGAAAGTSFGPWGAAIGGAVGGVGNAINYNANYNANKKKKEQKIAKVKTLMDQQRGYSDKMTQANLLGTGIQAMIPNYINERADFSDERRRTDRVYDDAVKNIKNSQANRIATATSAGNSTIRNLGGSLTPAQQQNLLANSIGQNYATSNNLAVNDANRIEKFNIDENSMLNNSTMQEKEINRGLTNQEGYAETDKWRRVASDTTNTFIDDLNRKSQLGMDEFELQRAVELGNAAELAASQGRFNNTMLMAGNVAGNFNRNTGDTINNRSTTTYSDTAFISFMENDGGQPIDSVTYKTEDGTIYKKTRDNDNNYFWEPQ
jgi:hypothetical protein